MCLLSPSSCIILLLCSIIFQDGPVLGACPQQAVIPFHSPLSHFLTVVNVCCKAFVIIIIIKYPNRYWRTHYENSSTDTAKFRHNSIWLEWRSIVPVVMLYQVKFKPYSHSYHSQKLCTPHCQSLARSPSRNWTVQIPWTMSEDSFSFKRPGNSFITCIFSPNIFNCTETVMGEQGVGFSSSISTLDLQVHKYTWLPAHNHVSTAVLSLEGDDDGVWVRYFCSMFRRFILFLVCFADFCTALCLFADFCLFFSFLERFNLICSVLW